MNYSLMECIKKSGFKCAKKLVDLKEHINKLMDKIKTQLQILCLNMLRYQQLILRMKIGVQLEIFMEIFQICLLG